MSVTARNTLKVAALASSMAIIFTIAILSIRGCGPDCALGDQAAVWDGWTRALDGATTCAVSTTPPGCALGTAGCSALLTAKFGSDIPIEAVQTRLDVYFKGQGYVTDTAVKGVRSPEGSESHWIDAAATKRFVVRVAPRGDAVDASIQHTPPTGP